MSSTFRSEPMKLYQLIIQKDGAFNVLAELGQHELIHFNEYKASSNVLQKTYIREVQRCTSIERSLKNLANQIWQSNIPEGKNVLKFDNFPEIIAEVGKPKDLLTIEYEIEEREKVVMELSKYEENLKNQLDEMKEFEQVLDKVNDFFIDHVDDEAINTLENVASSERISLINEKDIERETSNASNEVTTPWFVAGIIGAQKRFAFERVLWRACRRTAFVRTTLVEIEDNIFSPKKPERCVFIIFFKGKKLQDIVDRVCDGFGAKQYPCPKTAKDRHRSELEIKLRMDDLVTVINSTISQKGEVLTSTAKQINEWWREVHLQKTIYHYLNSFKFDTSGNFFIAEAWIPDTYINQVRDILQECVTKRGAVLPIINVIDSIETPPTLTITNKFTNCFQGIVNSYGVPTYREINPSIFTIITFPFLFAIMFGDAGHGIILALFGFYLIYKEKIIEKIDELDEISSIFFGGRYIIFLMGLMSIYTGLIYNDAFAKSFNIFGSSWTIPYTENNINNWVNQSNKKSFDLTLDPLYAYNDTQGPYIIGVDPIWNLARNKLTFLNSMKMKASILIGVTQMTFGIFLSFFNYWEKKSLIDILTNFIPQLFFLTSIFIYLCIQIIVKWIYYSVKPAEIFSLYYPGPHCAPSLLIGLINLVMLKKRDIGFVNGNETKYEELKACYLNQWYPNQNDFEQILLLIALTCIPVMLLGKPIYESIKRKKKSKNYLDSKNINESLELISVHSPNEENNIGNIHIHKHSSSNTINTSICDKKTSVSGEHGESMGNIIVHQAIHSIEFILGCVSHTASYLRLWALSLAHAQLSEILWEKVLVEGMNVLPIYSPIATFLAFFIFFILTISILVLMEGLSAFLHALRLHWVEFQSKFYEGNGYNFNPFSLKAALKILKPQYARE
ncbi:V-type ATPase, V0 complex, 116kDa subunit family and ATPase, V0 complex, subunit 116kDa, eukaryotic family-containing protein [Strongyloides ratti]|uniref:V-type proton ATPase subunit a n=1 Tax=Strongyloides ratti TaxID=34506 RepID=A0A090KP44_STRRB|nr:V-type ATPase, V0 complex, 116kDa subunit family and ATPase, V0 complex, subunit 116kDa, eukaryotic family-containing protein [Strongyloides ratti]CEF59373.1 V-type ATPase, V0 complex, 116kDa subunit family and ATPase, V0 complex, subunit 116kDa, eukaryotic family-containing protein [Strongyloides ratti]